MRSLLLSPEAPIPARSGLPLRVLHLARALAQEVDLDVVALSGAPVPAVDEPFHLAHLPGDWNQWTRARQLLQAAWEPEPVSQIRSRPIARHVRRQRWDVIQAHELSMLRFASGAPCVLDAADVLSSVKQTMAATDSRRGMRPWWRFEALKAARCEAAAAVAATAVSVPTDADAAAFERLGARRVIVVRNGIDLVATPHELPTAGAHIVLVAYFAWRPNAEAARELRCQVLPRVQARVPGATLSLVGAMLPAEPTAAPGPAVEVTGAVADVLPHLRRARVTVMPLRAGGGSRIKVLEALAAGVPVVATPFAVGGIEVRDGVHALIGETAADLAAQTVRVIEDDDLARELSLAGRRLVESRYGWPQVARPLLDLHRELGERAVAA